MLYCPPPPKKKKNWESLPKSYHLGLLLRTQWRHCGQHNNLTAKRTVWLYQHADWLRAQRLIEETDWNSFITNDINVSMDIMKECIPRRSLSTNHNLPWLSKCLIQLMRKRNMLFSRAKRTNKKFDFEKYKRTQNRVVSQLRLANSKFFNSIDPSNPKKFWKAVKYLDKNAAQSLPSRMAIQ